MHARAAEERHGREGRQFNGRQMPCPWSRPAGSRSRARWPEARGRRVLEGAPELLRTTTRPPARLRERFAPGSVSTSETEAEPRRAGLSPVGPTPSAPPESDGNSVALRRGTCMPMRSEVWGFEPEGPGTRRAGRRRVRHFRPIREKRLLAFLVRLAHWGRPCGSRACWAHFPRSGQTTTIGRRAYRDVLPGKGPRKP